MDYHILTCFTLLNSQECHLRVHLSYMKIVKGFSKQKCRQSEKCVFNIVYFLNKDFPLNIVRKHINIFTVILESILEGRVSHFFDLGLCSFFISCRKKGESYFLQFFTFHMIKK